MRLRAAVPADATALWAVRSRAIHHVGHDGCSAAQLAAWSARRTPASFAEPLLTQPIVVAETDDGRVVGYAGLEPVEGIVEACYVDPDVERRGVGRALMRALEDEAARRGLTRLALEATPNAVPFYEALGYRALGGLALALGAGQSIAGTLMARELPARGDQRSSSLYSI